MERQLPKLKLLEARKGPWRIERFSISQQEAELHQLREAINGRDRGVEPGEYTALVHDRRGIVMSDTPAESRDHFQVVDWLDEGAKTFLVHGLGLGLIATWLCSDPRTERVDVVEFDQDVIDLVGSQLSRFDRLHIHHGDAFTFEFPDDFPDDQRWDAAWHDIWDSICSDNLPEMDALEGRYASRVKVQGSWAREVCEQKYAESRALLREVYRQRGKAIGDEAAAKVGMDPIDDMDLDERLERS